MKHLIAADWGTSSLRVALLDGQGRVLQEAASARGIMTVAADQFATVLIASCAQWERAAGTLFILSGMVGSRQGWHEAPYCACPAGFADVAARLAWIAPGPDHLRAAIVPGLSCENAGVPDVMRGEETQVLGALDLLGLEGGWFVLPGTHSKWVRVEHGRIVRFSTFMTGEFYALLRTHSILARTLPGIDGGLDAEAFTRGVLHAKNSASLLHCAFSARTLALFDRLPADALPSYLSGLVIGEEMRAQPPDALRHAVVVVGTAALTERYRLALEVFGCPATCVGPEATWRGLWTIARTLENVE